MYEEPYIKCYDCTWTLLLGFDRMSGQIANAILKISQGSTSQLGRPHLMHLRCPASPRSDATWRRPLRRLALVTLSQALMEPHPRCLLSMARLQQSP